MNKLFTGGVRQCFELVRCKKYRNKIIINVTTKGIKWNVCSESEKTDGVDYVLLYLSSINFAIYYAR